MSRHESGERVELNSVSRDSAASRAVLRPSRAARLAANHVRFLRPDRSMTCTAASTSKINRARCWQQPPVSAGTNRKRIDSYTIKSIADIFLVSHDDLSRVFENAPRRRPTSRISDARGAFKHCICREGPVRVPSDAVADDHPPVTLYTHTQSPPRSAHTPHRVEGAVRICSRACHMRLTSPMCHLRSLVARHIF